MAHSIRWSERLVLGVATVSLRRLERKLFNCIWLAVKGGTPSDSLSARLHLSMKACASALATVLLLKADMRQEAEAPQRSFLEAWILMLHFSWFPLHPAFQEWLSNPGRPLDGRKYPVKSDVENEIPNRLGLMPGQQILVKELFKVLSNTSIHPTRDSVERSWTDAVSRRGFRFPDPNQENLYAGIRTIVSVSKLAVFLVDLHLFLQSLRLFVLSDSAVPGGDRLKEMTFLERFLGLWMKVFRDRLKLAFKTYDEGYGKS